MTSRGRLRSCAISSLPCAQSQGHALRASRPQNAERPGPGINRRPIDKDMLNPSAYLAHRACYSWGTLCCPGSNALSRHRRSVGAGRARPRTKAGLGCFMPRRPPDAWTDAPSARYPAAPGPPWVRCACVCPAASALCWPNAPAVHDRRGPGRPRSRLNSDQTAVPGSTLWLASRSILKSLA